jgi:hypothetical protein
MSKLTDVDMDTSDAQSMDPGDIIGEDGATEAGKKPKMKQHQRTRTPNHPYLEQHMPSILIRPYP